MRTIQHRSNDHQCTNYVNVSIADCRQSKSYIELLAFFQIITGVDILVLVSYLCPC